MEFFDHCTINIIGLCMNDKSNSRPFVQNNLSRNIMSFSHSLSDGTPKVFSRKSVLYTVHTLNYVYQLDLLRGWLGKMNYSERLE